MLRRVVARQSARTAVHASSKPTASPATAQFALEPVYLSLSPNLATKSKNTQKKQSDQVVALDPTVFKHPLRSDILHLCVNHYRDSLRQGSANTKTRSEVKVSGRKLRPQKGSGRARLGDASSPMLRGGAVAFGPKPRDFSTKLNRKVVQMGLRVALSSRLKENRLGIMSELLFPAGKTNHLANKLDEYGMRKTLLVTGEEDPCKGLERATRVLTPAKICGLMKATDVNVYDLVKWPRVVMDLKALDFFERTLAKSNIPISYPQTQ